MNPITLDWIAKNVVVVIAKTMNHVTISVENVLVDARMGTLRNIVIAVRNCIIIDDILHIDLLFFIQNKHLLRSIACEAGSDEQLFFSMFSKLQWDM